MKHLSFSPPHRAILVLFCSFLLFASGCQKSENNSVDFTNYSGLSSKIIAAISLQSPPAIKQSHSMLSPQEKEQLWMTKWNMIKVNDKEKLTANQLKVVDMLISLLQSKGAAAIENDHTIGENFLSNNMELINSSFTNVQQYFLIEFPFIEPDFSIYKANEYMDRFMQSTSRRDAPVIYDCECYYSLSCWNGVGDYCDDKIKCTKVKECGLLGSTYCTGRCSQNVIN